MKVSVTITMLVAIVLLAGVSPVEAQYYGPSPVQSLVQGNLNLVHGSRMYGYGQQGYYSQYQPYQQYQQPQQQYQYQYQQAQQSGVKGALTKLLNFGMGAGEGYLLGRAVSNNPRVQAGFAAGGGAIGLIWPTTKGQQKQQQYQYQQQQPQQGYGQLVPAPMPEQNERQDSQPAPNMGAEPWPTQQNQSLPQQGAMVTVKNCTRFQVEVYDWDTSIETLQPGESVSISASTRGGYRALASIPSGNQTVRSWTDSRFVDSTDSILFVEPK